MDPNIKELRGLMDIVKHKLQNIQLQLDGIESLDVRVTNIENQLVATVNLVEELVEKLTQVPRKAP